MSRYVQLEPDGLFEYKWIGKKQEYRRRRVKRDIVLTYLRDRCDIVEGTTLRDIFRTVAKYKLLKAVIAQYSWCSHIDEFHAQAEEPMRRTDDQEPLDYLEIYYHPQIQKYKKEVSFDFYCGFHGIGPVPPDYEYANPGYITYSVSYSPMYELADLPVKLNKEFKVYTPFDPGKKQKPDERLLIDATREYCLLEILDAIYDDISFHGGPAENAAFIEQMKDTVEKIKSGEIKTVPIDEVFKDLEEEDSSESA